jgi:hypothetical protein
MPYKSDAQRRFFHTDTAKKAGITTKEVDEFDKASKGKKLPEKKMAFGGETNPKHETLSAMQNNPSAGFANGGLVHSLGDSDNGTLAGLRDLLMRAQRGEDINEAPKLNPEDEMRDGKFIGEFNTHSSSEPVKGYAEGGLIEAFEKLLGNKGDSAVKSDKSEAAAADAIDPVIEVKPSTDTAKGYANGGDVTGSEFDPDQPYPTQDQGDEGLPSSRPLFARAVDAMGNAVMGAASDALGPTTDISDVAAARLTGSPVTIPQVNAEQLAGLRSQSPQIPLNNVIHQANMGQPATPTPNPILQASQAAQGMPATPADIYQGISAGDRAALMQKLLAAKAQPGNLAAQGVGGLADAITSGFGKSPTNFQQQIRGTQAQNVQNQIGVVDTQRQQVLQDIQAKIAVQESDPTSPYSQGMRQFLQAQGMKVPSGMSASMLKQTLPDVTKIFDTKMVAATAAGAQGIDAAKGLLGETFADWLKETMGMGGVEAGEQALENRVAGTTNTTPAQRTPNGVSYRVK